MLHIGKFYPPHQGGMETHLHDLTVRLARLIDVKVVVANDESRTEHSIIKGVDVTRVARITTIASMPVCPGLMGAIRRSPADLVHLHMPNPGAALALLQSGHKGRIIVTHHADTLGRKMLRRLSDPFVHKVMARAAAIIATSGRYLRTSTELAPFRDKCRVIPLGIDVSSLDSVADGTNKGVVSDLPIILTIGRLVPYKGFDVLIHAMKSINATLIMIGKGPLQEQLCSLVKSEGLTEKVRMLGSVEDLRPYFRAASIFVVPSVTRAEAFGLVQLEAMASSLPVINTDIDSGVPEVSVDCETGLTIPARDVNRLAQAIQFLLDHEDIRRNYGQAARRRVLREYTADLMAERTFELYQDALRQS